MSAHGSAHPSAPAFPSGGDASGPANPGKRSVSVVTGYPVCTLVAETGGGERGGVPPPAPPPLAHYGGCACAAAPPREPLFLRLCSSTAQWWLFGLGFLCPLLWVLACGAPLVACCTAGSLATRTRLANKGTIVAMSLSFTAALTAVILGSIAAALLVIKAGGGNGAGGLGVEYEWSPRWGNRG